MAGSNIIQLRQLLREKFPGLRTRADELPVQTRACWSTGLPALDQPLGGGFPKGALTEVVASSRSSGAASLIAHLIRQASAARQFAALVDAADSFDPACLHAAELQRLLWLRCHDGAEAIKTADLVFRDGNLPLVLFDLALIAEAQLRRIPAPAWYRFQRIVEERGTVAVVVTPQAMVSPAESRVTLHSRFDLESLDLEPEEWASEVEFEVFEPRHGFGHHPLRRTA